MAWTSQGDAVTLAAGYSIHTTSTSTLVVGATARMYFVRAELEFPELIPSSAPTLLDGGVNALGYIESDTSFEFSAVDELFLTAVPTDKEAVPRIFPDGTLRSYTYVRYQDPHILELPRGMGYLMVMAEYLAQSPWGERALEIWTWIDADDEGEVLTPSRSNGASTILAYWSSSPDFGEHEVTGPVWVVARSQPWPAPDSGDTALAWLGVPASCVLTVDGVEYLYVYFVAELSSFEGDAVDNSALNENLHGIYVRRLRLEHVMSALGAPWMADGTDEGNGHDESIEQDLSRDPDTRVGVTSETSFRIPTFVPPDPAVNMSETPLPLDFELPSIDWTDEASWDLSIESHLLPGENLGKVRIWVATGDVFPDGGDPKTLDQGNTQFEQYYRNVKTVDPTPVVSEGQLVLYFCANTGGSGTSLMFGYGIWCAGAVASTATYDYGLDFTVYPVDLTTDTGERNLVAAGTYDATDYSMETGRLDPDPAQLPDGSWIVATGVVEGDPPSVTQLLRVEGDATDGLPSGSSPWS